MHMLWEILHSNSVVLISEIANNFHAQCSLAVNPDFMKRKIVFHNDIRMLVYEIVDIFSQFCVWHLLRGALRATKIKCLNVLIQNWKWCKYTFAIIQSFIIPLYLLVSGFLLSSVSCSCISHMFKQRQLYVCIVFIITWINVCDFLDMTRVYVKMKNTLHLGICICWYRGV
jgi:hypothetical protein